VLPIHEIDKLVGKRIRLRREALGLSPRRFGRKLGLTYYQVQKYENGTVPIGATRLWQFAIVLKVPIDYFFEDFDRVGDDDADPQSDELRELVRLFGSIQDGSIRQTLLELMRSIVRDAEPRHRLERARKE
jgi:transcriptional regulator with XRE-family HTH domain